MTHLEHPRRIRLLLEIQFQRTRTRISRVLGNTRGHECIRDFQEEMHIENELMQTNVSKGTIIPMRLNDPISI